MTIPPFPDNNVAEDDVERLLGDFFAREMPPDLRTLPDRSLSDRSTLSRDAVPVAEPSPAAAPHSEPRRRWRTVLTVLTLTACGLVAAVTVVPRSVPPQSDAHHLTDRAEPPGGAPAVTDQPAATPEAEAMPPNVGTASATASGATASGEPPLIIVDGEPSSDRRSDHRTPVEARSSHQWTTAGDATEPQSDFSSLNETTVEILPLEGDLVEPRTPPRRPDDTRLPEERGGTP